MLSKAILQCINLICKLGYLIGSFPYEWDAKCSRIRTTSSSLKLRQWKLLTLYMYINTTFMIIRMIQALTVLNISSMQIIMNMFNVVTWASGCAFQTNTLFHRDELAEFINQFMKTVEYFHSNVLT